MTTIRTIQRRVLKRGKRVLEYRAQLTSKGRVTFVTPQWYSRRKDLMDVLEHLLSDIARGRVTVTKRP